MVTKPIESIVIVGGGTAGYMCAAALSHGLPKTVRITLIESTAIGTVGVGEGTLPSLRNFNAHVGVDELEFIQRCEASFKLGVDFVDWGHAGNRYFHAFGDYGSDIEGLQAYALWRKLRALGDTTPLAAYNLPAQMALAGRFIPPNPDPRSPLHDYSYAFHLDASLYAALLREKVLKRGVVHIDARIAGVRVEPESGFIAGVTLEDGRDIDADFFIDCSGFRGLLIEEALKTGYTDWSHWLPVDAAWAVPTASTGDLVPYTRSTAREAGWQWRIPLQHRTGNGHVFSHGFTTPDAAHETLVGHLEGAMLKDPMLIRFQTGHRNRFWHKNCVAIGLASGFIEPLESTSINFIQTQIARLLDLFPVQGTNAALEDEFNRLTLREYVRVRDFIILHYRLNKRPEPLWRYTANMPLPDELAHKIAVFQARGRVVLHEGDAFSAASWTAIFAGQGVVSHTYDPLADRWTESDLRSLMRQRRDGIARLVPQLPTLDAFIAANCPSPAYLKQAAV